jgi:hypothetical protein
MFLGWPCEQLGESGCQYGKARSAASHPHVMLHCSERATVSIRQGQVISRKSFLFNVAFENKRLAEER